MRKLDNSELDRKSISDFKLAPKTPLTIILDDIRSLNNIGSVFRTSDAFLIEKIYLCGITAVPPNKEIHKTALGATETVAWEYAANVLDLIPKLQQDGLQVWAIEQVDNAISLEKFEIIPHQKYALVFGNEVFGVNEQAVRLCNGAIEIPQLGTKHSLNIAVSAGIVLWDLFKKIRF
ncbi:RNA methyltransferase [Flavobacterium branchiophilum]|uniref:Probable tRNA/rRNA methyltransferase n=1 Tax=Flavobacterium branchiophilum (strain FL-15) TaxID=1034807 RepID=G2Z567_FLABF|nr:RNA methyltransferase [Flavobacterium branchiophilum]CCB68573.1 Probable tRNA/rRNA methyltransferase [Flavobacterium branchiophilum FL-15]